MVVRISPVLIASVTGFLFLSASGHLELSLANSSNVLHVRRASTTA